MKIEFLKPHNIDGKNYRPKDEADVADRLGESLVRRKIAADRSKSALPSNPTEMGKPKVEPSKTH